MTASYSRIVTVFGSSRVMPDDDGYTTAYRVGSELGAAGFVVCNGGYGGIMEASARGAKDAGGRTIGIICTSFGTRSANAWIDETIPEPTLIDRMMKLISLADAYVVLRGGTGTLLELAAVWELMNKGLIRKKPFVAVGGFWLNVIQTLKDELAWEGAEHAGSLITFIDSPDGCVRFLKKNIGGPTPGAGG